MSNGSKANGIEASFQISLELRRCRQGASGGLAFLQEVLLIEGRYPRCWILVGFRRVVLRVMAQAEQSRPTKTDQPRQKDCEADAGNLKP